MERRKNYGNRKSNFNASTDVADADNVQNPYVIPKITSLPPALLPSSSILTKDDVGTCRTTRQRTNNTNLQPNSNKISKVAATEAATNVQLSQQQLLKTAEKNDNEELAKCVASPLEQLAAVQAKATSSRNKNEEAINDLKTRIPEIENIFDIHGRIGNGTFSTVLLGTLKKQRGLPGTLRREYAIKHHIPTSHPDRIMKELQCMAKIGGTCNVVGINCCIRCNESVAFVMPYLAHDRFHDFYNKMDVAEVQFYMKNLLIALRHVHSFSVIHRDVKPSNFLYSRRKRQFLLVDFGLAQPMTASSIMLTNNNNQHSLKSDNLVPSGGGEGKRLREHDDTNEKKSLDGAVAISGGGEFVSGTAKRIRCVTPVQEVQTTAVAPAGPTTRSAKVVNTGSKGTPPSGGSNASANERKSAGAANMHSMSSRLQQKLRESVQHGSTRTSSAGGVKKPPAAQPANNNNNNNNNNCNSFNNNNIDAKYNTNRNLSTTNAPKCYCYGNHQVCNICLVKKEIHASRAGTPGYRPPEVLLKYPDQTTAVDVWAAGVIFLSILSSVYPFFKAPNDYVALAEMITIFGDKTIRKTAYVLDRLVTLSQKTKPLDLRKLCVRFRNRVKFSSPELLKKYQRIDGTCEICKNCDQFFFNCLCLDTSFVTESLDEDDIYPPSAYDLLYRLLETNPHKRVTADEALQHPFLLECHNNDNKSTSNSLSSAETSSAPVGTSAVPLNTPSII